MRDILDSVNRSTFVLPSLHWPSKGVERLTPPNYISYTVDPRILGSWPRLLQGLCGLHDADPSPPYVHCNDHGVYNPPCHHAHWAPTPTGFTMVWDLELTFSTSTVFAVPTPGPLGLTGLRIA
jgi:hypothetical protein